MSSRFIPGSLIQVVNPGMTIHQSRRQSSRLWPVEGLSWTTEVRGRLGPITAVLPTPRVRIFDGPAALFWQCSQQRILIELARNMASKGSRGRQAQQIRVQGQPDYLGSAQSRAAARALMDARRTIRAEGTLIQLRFIGRTEDPDQRCNCARGRTRARLRCAGASYEAEVISRWVRPQSRTAAQSTLLAARKRSEADKPRKPRWAGGNDPSGTDEDSGRGNLHTSIPANRARSDADGLYERIMQARERVRRMQ